MNANISSARRRDLDIAIGTAMLGGFYGGAFMLDGELHGLIVSPRGTGYLPPQVWIPEYADVPGATSLVDGLANTRAMAAAGSALAKSALATTIGEFSDWYINALDEQEVLYRNLKPTADVNSRWYRSGINLSANPPTWPYSADIPPQTAVAAFQAGGAQAYEPDGHWSSTQHASLSSYAWSQDFDDGGQGSWDEANELRARLVRRFAFSSL